MIYDICRQKNTYLGEEMVNKQATLKGSPLLMMFYILLWVVSPWVCSLGNNSLSKEKVYKANSGILLMDLIFTPDRMAKKVALTQPFIACSSARKVMSPEPAARSFRAYGCWWLLRRPSCSSCAAHETGVCIHFDPRILAPRSQQRGAVGRH